MNTEPDLILLIDDDEDVNYFHRRAITRSGLKCQIDVCTSGDIAMDYLKNEGEFAVRGDDFRNPDLIFLDINMPRVDGWEFLDRYTAWIDQNQQAPATVIVMLSTSTQKADIERAKKAPHINEYVSKPLNSALVIEIIKEHFPNSTE